MAQQYTDKLENKLSNNKRKLLDITNTIRCDLSGDRVLIVIRIPS